LISSVAQVSGFHCNQDGRLQDLFNILYSYHGVR
jgi:hypothetical protein